MNPTSGQLRQLRRDNARYPEALIDIPVSDWPADLPTSSDSIRVRVMRSRKFLVQVFAQGMVTRLSVNRTEWDSAEKRWREDISWDDLQRLKREAGFGDACAVELFPPDNDVVNVANMRHLFITPCPIFMWRKD
jgi:hypothetical protein